MNIYEDALDLLRTDGFTDLGMVAHTFAMEIIVQALAAALDKGGQRSVRVAFRPASG